MLIPATTREENGKFVFQPPRWRRSRPRLAVDQ